MKHLFFVILFLVSSFTWSQSGFDVIRKAQKKTEQRKYEKALRLLDRAENMNYGFCGNAWMDADCMITETRAQIYTETDRFELAANTLNESRWNWCLNDNDSLKTVYFVQAFGKELVKREIDSCIALISSKTVDSTAFDLSLLLDVTFSKEPFRIGLPLDRRRLKMVSDELKDANKTVVEKLKIALREQPFYQVLLD